MRRAIALVLLMLLVAVRADAIDTHGGGSSGGASSSAPLSGAGTPASPITLPTTASPQVAHLGVSAPAPTNAGATIIGGSAGNPGLILRGFTASSGIALVVPNSLGADLSDCGPLNAPTCGLMTMLTKGGTTTGNLLVSGKFRALIDSTGKAVINDYGGATVPLATQITVMGDVPVGYQQESTAHSEQIAPFALDDDLGTFSWGMTDEGRLLWGGAKQVSSCTESSTTATCTSVAHGFSSGQIVAVEGVEAGDGTNGYNGIVTLSGVTADTFSYTTVGSVAGLGASLVRGFVMDTFLWRGGAKDLKTNNQFSVGGFITTGGATAASCSAASPGDICMPDNAHWITPTASAYISLLDTGAGGTKLNGQPFITANTKGIKQINKLGGNNTANVANIDATGTKGFDHFGDAANTDGSIIDAPTTISDLATTGAATGKTVVCADTTGKLYRSSTGTDCSN